MELVREERFVTFSVAGTSVPSQIGPQIKVLGSNKLRWGRSFLITKIYTKVLKYFCILSTMN